MSNFAQDSGFPPLTNDQLQLYLQRIGVAPDCATLSPTVGCLQKIIRHHCLAIPFENGRLLLLRESISLQVNDVFHDLVVNRRGGYCFQQNVLLLSALKALGFTAYAGVARCANWTTDGQLYYPGITHSVLFVKDAATDQLYLADVGFSDNGLTAPIPVVDGAQVTSTGGEAHKVVKEQLTESLNGGWFVKHRRAEGRGIAKGSDADGWAPQYYFTTEPLMYGDYRVLNYYTSTYPEYIFNVDLVTVLIKDYGRVTLWNHSFHRRHHDKDRCESRKVETLEETVALLKDDFHIDLSDAEVQVLRKKLFNIA